MAAKTKRKTVIHAVKCENGVVVAETEYDRNLLKNLPIGCAVKIEPMRNNRNYQHHKKFFALLECGLEYWEPKFHFKNLIYHFSVVPLNYYFYLDVNVIKMPTGPNFLNPPAWSLGAELQAYLLLVLAIKFRMLGFILAIFSFCVFAIANLGFINSDIFGYRLVCGVFFIFYTGLLIFNKEYKKLSFFYVLSIILLLTLIIKGSFGIYSIETLSGYLIGVGLVLTHEKLKLKLKFNEVFGSISYSLFICHTLFIWFCDLVFKSQNLILITFFCIIFGLANYFLVEKSINKIRFG